MSCHDEETSGKVYLYCEAVTLIKCISFVELYLTFNEQHMPYYANFRPNIFSDVFTRKLKVLPEKLL